MKFKEAFLYVIGGQIISIYLSQPSGPPTVSQSEIFTQLILSQLYWLLIWQMNSHASPTGVAFQSLQLKHYCAGEWGRHKACCQEHATHTYTHTILSLPHGALAAKVSAFSRQNKGVWKGLGNYRGMCISVYTVELTWRQLWRAQFKSTTGRPCVRQAQLMAQSPNWAFDAEFTHQPTVCSWIPPVRRRRGLCWHVIIPQLMSSSGRDSGGPLPNTHHRHLLIGKAETIGNTWDFFFFQLAFIKTSFWG